LLTRQSRESLINTSRQLLQKLQKTDAILILPKDPLRRIPAHAQMIERVLEFNSEPPGDEQTAIEPQSNAKI
jgi:hypothetical protein